MSKDLNAIDKELIGVEMRAICENMNMASICLAMASIAPVGSESWRHYLAASRPYIANVVTHMNEVGLISGELDMNDPANIVLRNATREAEKLNEEKRAKRRNN